MNTATEIAWTTWDRVCRIGGQGLTEGNTYRITDLWYEVLGRDMMVSHATAIDTDGNQVAIKNAHIAFDIEDLIGA